MRVRNIDIPQQAIEELCREHHIRRLILRDDFGPDSDVDVLVEFDPGHIPGFAFFGIQDELSELIGRRVDLNTPEDLSPYFRYDVLREAESLYAAA